MHTFVLFLGIVVVSFSGIMIKASTASANAISFFRVFFAFLCYLCVMKARVVKYKIKEELLLLISGLFLAMHFHFWVQSFSHTTLAGAVVPLMLQPFVTSILAAYIYREKLNVSQILSTVLVIIGVVQMTVLDAKSSLSLSKGDLLSITGVLFVCGFLLIGRYMIPRIGTIPFNFRSYSVATVILFLLSFDKVFNSFSPKDWLLFIGLGVGCSFFGYVMVNNSLKHFPTGVVSMALVGEPVLSILWSWMIFKESATIAQYVGLVLSLVGIVWFFSSLKQRT
ncbi:MAG: DMT family transporter [Pseudothermotoga sp.]